MENLRYEILERLATGSMAEIYLGKLHIADKTPIKVVIKKIHPSYLQNKDIIDMFEVEAIIAKRLNHPNIVKTYGIVRTANDLNLIMDFIPGKNLRQVIDRLKTQDLPLSSYFSIEIIRRVCDALDYFHHLEKDGKPLNLIHRDINPQNIMVGYDGTIKLVDFGIAKVATLKGITRAGVLKGKLPYLSPEQAKQQTLDKRTDIYSAGLTLYELLVGKRAYESKIDAELIKMAREAAVPSLSNTSSKIPKKLDLIVSKALEPNITQRFQTAAEFSNELSNYLNSQCPNFGTNDVSQLMKTLFKEDFYLEQKILHSQHNLSVHTWPAFIETGKGAINGVRQKLDHYTALISKKAVQTIPAIQKPKVKRSVIGLASLIILGSSVLYFLSSSALKVPTPTAPRWLKIGTGNFVLTLHQEAKCAYGELDAMLMDQSVKDGSEILFSIEAPGIKPLFSIPISISNLETKKVSIPISLKETERSFFHLLICLDSVKEGHCLGKKASGIASSRLEHRQAESQNALAPDFLYWHKLIYRDKAGELFLLGNEVLNTANRQLSHQYFQQLLKQNKVGTEELKVFADGIKLFDLFPSADPKPTSGVLTADLVKYTSTACQ